MLLLNLFDDVIIVVVLFWLCLIFESRLADSKSWFFDDKIGVLLFLLYHSCGDVTVDQVVAAHCRRILILFYKFSLYFWFESSAHLFFFIYYFGIVRSRSRFLFLFWFFWSSLCWAELSSISTLNLIDKFILHGISWLVWSWSWYFCMIVDQRRASLLNFNFYLLALSGLSAEFKAYIVASWTQTCLWGFFGSLSHGIKPAAGAKTSGLFSWSCFGNFWYL